MDKLLTAKNIKRAGKAVKYGVAFANAYNEMSQVLPVNNLLPDFMRNIVVTQTMGATPKTINAMNSANEKRDCLLNGIKQDLERGDVSQFEMLMQGMQAYAQRENDRVVSELMQRMYNDIYGDVSNGGMHGGLPAASAFEINDSLRCMVDNCSISPQSDNKRRPIPAHHHAGVCHDTSMQASFSGARVQEGRHNCNCCPRLPPPPYHPAMSASFHNSPHTKHCSHNHTGPPVSHMQNSYTTSGAPASNHHNATSGPIIPCDSYNAPARLSTSDSHPQPTVPFNNYSPSTMPHNGNAPIGNAAFDATAAGSISQSTNSTSSPSSTIHNAPITGCVVTHDNVCNTAPPTSATHTSSAPFTESTDLHNASISSGGNSLFTVPTTIHDNHMDQAFSNVAPNNHIHAMSNSNYSTAVHPGGPPVSQSSYASIPAVPSAPYRNDVSHVIPPVNHNY